MELKYGGINIVDKTYEFELEDGTKQNGTFELVQMEGHDTYGGGYTRININFTPTIRMHNQTILKMVKEEIDSLLTPLRIEKT